MPTRDPQRATRVPAQQTVASVQDEQDEQDDDVAALVLAAAAGDQVAWDGIVERYHRLVWAVVRSYRLSSSDAADVTQITWLRLVEHLGSIREPARVGAWLATTARREALRLSKQRRADLERTTEVDLVVLPSDGPSVEDALLREEVDAALHRALRGLGDRCQQLLRALACSPPAHYDEISKALGMPVGSIGPTRGRCLDRLRAVLTEQGWSL